MSFTKMTTPPVRGAKVLDLLPQFAVPPADRIRDDINYWKAWRKGIAASGGAGVGRDYLTETVLADLDTGRMILSLVAQAPGRTRGISREVQIGYRRMMGALALTRLLRDTELGPTVFNAADAAGHEPHSINGDGYGSRWYLHVPRVVAPQLLPEFEPGVDKAWHEGEIIYVHVRDPARPSTTFAETYQNVMGGQEFNTPAQVTLWPHLKTAYFAMNPRLVFGQ